MGERHPPVGDDKQDFKKGAKESLCCLYFDVEFIGQKYLCFCLLHSPHHVCVFLAV